MVGRIRLLVSAGAGALLLASCGGSSAAVTPAPSPSAGGLPAGLIAYASSKGISVIDPLTDKTAVIAPLPGGGAFRVAGPVWGPAPDVAYPVIYFAIHDDRPPDTRAPELHALLDGGHTERGGAGLDEGARRGDGAVPVAVGLDDREDLHAGTDELARRAEIRPQRPEAHLGDRGPTLVFEHGAAAEKGVPIANGSPPFHSDPLTC